MREKISNLRRSEPFSIFPFHVRPQISVAEFPVPLCVLKKDVAPAISKCFGNYTRPPARMVVGVHLLQQNKIFVLERWRTRSDVKEVNRCSQRSCIFTVVLHQKRVISNVFEDSSWEPSIPPIFPVKGHFNPFSHTKHQSCCSLSGIQEEARKIRIGETWGRI